jgi:hypothetical protein
LTIEEIEKLLGYKIKIKGERKWIKIKKKQIVLLKLTKDY